MDGDQLKKNSYSMFCFTLIVHFVDLSLIYCILFRGCNEDRIINFLVGFSLALSTVILHKH